MPSSNRDVVQELQEILKQWDEDQAVSSKDPTPHLIKLCHLFERETVNFLKKDPDPFDDRHPVTAEPECALGQILRALFKKDSFVTKLVNHYLRENYFTSLGISQDSTELNTAACRLLIDLMYGLDIPQVFHESETTVMRLFSWAEKGPEPLRSYATGLLAAAMDIPEIAVSFKDSNAHLIPIVLKRLWELKDEDSNEEEKPCNSKVPERPFAHLNEESQSAPLVNGKDGDHSDTEESSPKRRKYCNSATTPTKNGNTSGTFNIFGSPKTPREGLGDPMMNSDCSNSSWAEMSCYIVGTFEMFPITRDTKQIFILKYLRPIGEYQESLGHIYEHNALDLIFHYINVRRTGNARLSFEALRFLGSLLFHKKFCLEFVKMGGMQKLLQVPRPSLPADGVALCLWYLAYCEEAVERICVLPDKVLAELIRYALWLLECSHQSSRTHAVMFFGMVFRFRAILEKFDEQDGLRKVLNMLSTLSLFQDVWEQDIMDEPNEVMMWQTVKQVCLSLKHYFEAHLALKVQNLQRLSKELGTSRHQHSMPSYKAVNVAPEVVEQNIEHLLEFLPHRVRWKPVEQFVSLKGLQLVLQLVAMVLNESFSPKTETAVFALDILYVISVMASVQAALCDKLTIPAGDDLLQTLDPQEVPGYAILVACIHENAQSVTTSPEIQKASLNVLINCLCAPINRPGSSNIRYSVSTTPGSSKKKSSNNGEDVINKSWDCVRTSNGIMYLLNVLHKKTPITDADCIRGLACRALVGLSRSETARQIMSKLPIFTNGQLQLLMKEPILQDKRMEHVKFQRHAMELIKAVSGRTKHEGDASMDVSMQSIHRADVVAQTKINYNKKQLLQLIQTHLVNEGYESVASALQQAAHLPPLPSASLSHTALGPPSRNMVTPPPSSRSHRHLVGGTSRLSYPMCKANQSSSGASGTSSFAIPMTPSPPPVSSPATTSSLSSPGSIHIKINRASKREHRFPSNSSISHFSKNETNTNTLPTGSLLNTNSVTASSSVITPVVTNTGLTSEPIVSLDRIVTEYLTNQHALCKNPVVTCPTFDLFQPHRCPEPRSLRASPTNFTMRITKRGLDIPCTGLAGSANNRKFIYSRYRPTQTLRPSEDDDVFLCCAFTPDDQFIVIGTTRGEVRLFSRSGNEEGVYTVHQGAVSTLVPHNTGSLLLTSCTAIHETSLWSISDLFDLKFSLFECQHADFNNAQDKIIGTSEQTAKLYDLNTSQVVSEFTPKLSNHYRFNRAVLDPTDELILTDGVLFDVRSGKQIHKFDKINPILNGVFHRNGLEVISSSEIWDLRTFHLLKTVPVLNLCDVVFNHTKDVIFGITVGDMLMDSQENAFETSFKTVDAADYCSIATVDVRRVVSSLAINQNDTQIAVVETENNSEDLIADAVVRLYEVGMTRQEDDELGDDEDDDDLGSDEEDTDDSDDDQEQNSQDGDESQNNDNNEEDDDGDSHSGSSFSSLINDGFESESSILFELNSEDGNSSDPQSSSLHAWLQGNDDEEDDDEDNEAEDNSYVPSE